MVDGEVLEVPEAEPFTALASVYDDIRTANPHELAARYVEQYGKMAQVAGSLEEALAIANRAVTKEDLICITGSMYLVGEAKKHFAARQAAQQQTSKVGG